MSDALCGWKTCLGGPLNSGGWGELGMSSVSEDKRQKSRGGSEEIGVWALGR